ncbi:MAG: hypothetical protein ACYC75_01680 [Minisyncoccota bacterium]
MGFFSSKKHTESIVLIDVGTNSVAGAYAHYKEDQAPVLLYTRRFPVEMREDESQEHAMFRALQILGTTLIREGAPILMRATGSGAASNILVSIDAPWQKTSVRIENFDQKTPFVFTKNLVAKELEKTRTTVPGMLLADESIIGTILNGYETNDPYGKKVHRASALVLTSLIDDNVAHGILAVLQNLYHTRRILPIAGSSLRYQAMRNVFPHERDALIVDATGSLTSIALIRKGLLVATAEMEDHTSRAWVDEVAAELAELAKSYPLPRTIFLLAREADASSLQQRLDTANLGKLWLSDNPPKIVSILASHIVGLVRQTTAAVPDILLLLMALYWQHRYPDESA